MARQENEGNKLKKGPWSAEEDEILRSHVEKHGARCWNILYSQGLLSRRGDSCGSRWHNHLKHGDERLMGPFTAEEERKVEELHARLGNKWSKIAAELPGRTKDDVKNYWRRRSRRKKLERETNKHITSSEPQTLNESLPLEAVQSSSSSPLVEQSSIMPISNLPAIQSSSSSQLVPQRYVYMNEEASKTSFEEDIFDTSLLFKSTTVPNQHEIEAESSLPDNATPDDFHDLQENIDVGDNWIDSSFPTPPPSTRDDHDTTLFSFNFPHNNFILCLGHAFSEESSSSSGSRY